MTAAAPIVPSVTPETHAPPQAPPQAQASAARRMSATPRARGIAAKGWLAAHRFLLLRRAAQLGFLAPFAAGPWAGVRIVDGTLAASMTLKTLPLTDPFVLAQSLAAGHWPELTALIGAAIVLAAYLLVGGRVYCSWFCPVNPVTDLAAWIGRRFGLGKGWQPRHKPRLALAAMALLVSAATGIIAWEQVNPISASHQALFFGAAGAALLVAAVFAFDLVVARHSWCGSLCPVGAFYGLIGRAALLRVAAPGRKDCDGCLDCYAICPEPQVITPALRGEHLGTSAGSFGPVILSGDCTNCGGCIDVCHARVFTLTTRFDTRVRPGADAVPLP